MPMKFVNILETSKLRIREPYLDSVSYVLLHFLTLRLYKNLAPVMESGGKRYFWQKACINICNNWSSQIVY